MDVGLPPVTLVDRDFDDKTYLWNAQQNMSEREGRVDVDAIYSRPSEDTFLVSLEQEESIQLNGRATGLRLADHDRYSDDPLEAIAEYAARLLAHVNGNQGLGWRIENEYTERSMDVVAENVTIIKRRAEKYEFDYTIRFRVGSAMMPPHSLTPRPTDPSTTARLAGQSLGEVEEMKISKRQELETHAYVGTGRSVEDNEIEAMSGAIKEVTLRGTIPGPESNRDAFDTTIRAHAGKNAMMTLETAFPGYDMEVMLQSHESTREAGVTRIGEYNTRVIEGTIGSTEGTVWEEEDDEEPDDWGDWVDDT